jgi:hypothetical protein
LTVEESPCLVPFIPHDDLDTGGSLKDDFSPLFERVVWKHAVVWIRKRL